MPIETKHPQWEGSIYTWQKSRDTMGGEKVVKSKNTKYLDMPTGMINLTTAPSVGGSGTENIHNITNQRDLKGDDRQYDPTWHSNPAYRAYLRRAKFPDIPAFTVRGLIGLATKKDIQFELPSSLAYLEDEFTSDGKSLEDFYKYALNEVLQTGRLPCVVDIVDGKLKVVTYSAESYINWKTDVFAVFEEEIKSGDDPFSHDRETQYLLLYIDPQTGVYMSKVLKDGANNFPTDPDDIPSFRGSTLQNELPLVVIGSTNNDNDVDQIPIEGISDCSLQIYRKSADLSQSQYLSCNPTLYATGVSSEDKPTALGSTVAWMIANSEAKVGYTQTDTSALNHVQATMESLFEEASNYGAQLLGSPKKMAEAAESIRLQQSASGATLASVVDTVSKGIEALINIMVEWSGASGEVNFVGSKEFSDMTLSSAELKELRESLMAGFITHETYLFNLQRSNYLREDVSVEDELDEIEIEGLPDEKDVVDLGLDENAA